VLLKEELGKSALASVAIRYLRIHPEWPLRFLNCPHPLDKVSTQNLNSVIIKTKFLLSTLDFKCKCFLFIVMCYLLIVAVISINCVHMDETSELIVAGAFKISEGILLGIE
jgi:hypothetical protein